MSVWKQDESGLSGTLNLGHYGISQSTSFQALNINPSATEIITPFAKLSVPYKVCYPASLSECPIGMHVASCTFHVLCVCAATALCLLYLTAYFL